MSEQYRELGYLGNWFEDLNLPEGIEAKPEEFQVVAVGTYDPEDDQEKIKLNYFEFPLDFDLGMLNFCSFEVIKERCKREYETRGKNPSEISPSKIEFVSMKKIHQDSLGFCAIYRARRKSL